jgi:hypothetical protein
MGAFGSPQPQQSDAGGGVAQADTYEGHSIGMPYNFQHKAGSSAQFRDATALQAMGADVGRISSDLQTRKVRVLLFSF